MPKGTTISHREVIEYFKSVTPDMRELVLDLINREVEADAERRAAFGKRMAKARAGRGRKKQVAESATPINGVTADPAIQAEVAAELPAHTPRRGRPLTSASTGTSAGCCSGE